MAGSQGKILAKIFCLKQQSAMDDEDMFRKFWTNVEGCEVTDMGDGQENFKVPNREEFEDQLWKLQNKFKKKKYKHLVLAISSHGKENELTSGNGKDEAASFEIRWWRGNLSTGYTMKIKDLLDKFREFQDKNIIFLMQMCRTRSNEGTVTGLGVDSGVSMHYLATLPRLGSPNVAYPLVVHGRTSSNETLSQARENMQWPKTWKLGQPCIRNSVMMFSASSGE